MFGRSNAEAIKNFEFESLARLENRRMGFLVHVLRKKYAIVDVLFIYTTRDQCIIESAFKVGLEKEVNRKRWEQFG